MRKHIDPSKLQHYVDEAYKDFQAGVHGEYIYSPLPGKAVCDFCRSPLVEWSYPCQDFTVQVLVEGGRTMQHGSLGEWAACQLCHDLIQNNHIDELEAWMLSNLGPSPIPVELEKSFISEEVSGFLANRKGEPYRFTGK